MMAPRLDLDSDDEQRGSEAAGLLAVAISARHSTSIWLKSQTRQFAGVDSQPRLSVLRY